MQQPLKKGEKTEATKARHEALEIIQDLSLLNPEQQSGFEVVRRFKRRKLAKIVWRVFSCRTKGRLGWGWRLAFKNTERVPQEVELALSNWGMAALLKTVLPQLTADERKALRTALDTIDSKEGI